MDSYARASQHFAPPRVSPTFCNSRHTRLAGILDIGEQSTSGGDPFAGVHYIQTLKLEPTIRIERTTCGLRISDNPTSDNLTPQETTNQNAPDMGADGAGLSCPGSSEVADEDGGKMVRLIQI